MDKSALVFLEEFDACRLAAAWPRLDADDATTWARTAGVGRTSVEQWGPPLRACGVCRLEDGVRVTDPLALAFIAKKAARWNKPTSRSTS